MEKLTAIVELFGHARVACEVSETEFGDDFLRLDIPDTPNQAAFTRIVSKKAIYAINPVTPDIMHMKAAEFLEKPITSYDIANLLKMKLEQSNLLKEGVIKDNGFSADLDSNDDNYDDDDEY